MSDFLPKLPPDYDSYQPNVPGKRSKTPTCGNCDEIFQIDYQNYQPPEGANIGDRVWCSPECFLSFTKNSMPPWQYALVYGAVCTLEKREVVARPSRFLMTTNGGDISTLDYLYSDTAEVNIEAGTKRFCSEDVFEDAVDMEL